MGTFANQSSLPALPVPSLDETLDKLIQNLEVFATSPAQLKQCVEKVEAFRKQDGPRLQEQLLHRAKLSKNWLEEWWLQYGYLKWSDGLAPAEAVYIRGMPQEIQRNMTSPIMCAALLNATATMLSQLERGTFQPVTMRGKPTCMWQFTKLFGAARIPGEQGDHLVQSCNTRHAVILYRNAFFAVDILDKYRGPREFAHILADVISIKHEVDRAAEYMRDDPFESIVPPIAALSGTPRDVWAQNRDKLCRVHYRNRQILARIDTALIMVGMSSLSPENDAEGLREMMAPSDHSRWFDKLSWIVFANGRAGQGLEHSVVDGFPASICVNFAMDYITTQWPTLAEEAARVERGTECMESAVSSPEGQRLDSKSDPLKDLQSPSCLTRTGRPLFKRRDHVEPLQWILNEEVLAAVEDAKECIRKSKETVHVAVHNMDELGSIDAKHMKISPDALFQIAVQLTYHRVFGRFVGTYESGSTFLFHHGRTETIRSVTKEMRDLVEAANVGAGLQKTTNSATAANASAKDDRKLLLNLLKRAAQKHVDISKEASAGQGIDRHLLGLRLLAMEHEDPVPPLFQDELFNFTGQWRLSTSQLPCIWAAGMVFRPVVHPDGIGIFYSPRKGYYNVVVTNFSCRPEFDGQNFIHELRRSMVELRELAMSGSSGIGIKGHGHSEENNLFSYSAVVSQDGCKQAERGRKAKTTAKL